MARNHFGELAAMTAEEQVVVNRAQQTEAK
jgi:hypothetical protein